MAALSQAVEDYLKVIYKLQAEDGATTTRIAEEMEVTSASVTNMIKRLAKMNLVDYTSHKGVSLSETGRRVALEIIRHHRLLELYLSEVMGYSWDQVHEEAENLEHHISEQFEDKIAELLNHPTHDPHGDPIPGKDGTIPLAATTPLSQADEGNTYLVGRVSDQNPELLRYLEQIGLLPGTKVKIIDKAPFDGPVTVKLEANEQTIGFNVSENIFVTDYEQSS